MKKLATLIIILFSTFRLLAVTINADTVNIDSAKLATPFISNNVDSLKQHLELLTNDSLKSGIYIQIAAQYLKYDTISGKRAKLAYQNAALNYTYLALHLYSRYNDTVGLRTCFNNLSKVYRSQKKYSQAKWFILQSNTLSRAKNDVPNIMVSLIELAAIKMEIKDYTLAMRDLNEAFKLSTDNHDAKTESHVQLNYALLYNRMKNYTKGTIAMKRHDFLDDSIRKNEEALIAVKTTVQDSLPPAPKKKVNPPPTGRKTYKANYSKKIASL